MNDAVSPPSRRTFCRHAAATAAFGILGGRASAQAAKARIKFGLLGLNHEHVFRMVQAVRDGGGELALVWAEKPEPQLAAKFFKENPGAKMAGSEAELLESQEIALIVNVAPPAERAAVGARIMRAGKDVLADKGGILSLEELDTLRRTQAETKRIYSISYNERLLMPVSVKIDELLKAGAIGRVTHMQGRGPHGLTHNPREPWFWTRAGHGGILVDVGAHQCDQFLYYTGSKTAEVVRATVGNVDNHDRPEFEDTGEMWLAGDGGTGSAQVSFYTGKSSGFQLMLTGTEGHMYVQKHVNHITLTHRNGKREEHRAPAGTALPFGRQLIDDVLARTETAMPQAHAFLASELAVRAQLAAQAGV
jgi:predicted dehydrogenase